MTTRKTPLYSSHLAAGAKMVNFAGWEMPIHYGSQIEEHHKVRRDAGVFDVSHMGVVDLRGEQSKAFLRFLLANDVQKLKLPGSALYSCMLDERGGIIDDLIVYYQSDQWFRLIINAGTREKDLNWIKAQAANYSVEIIEQANMAMLAIQGPNARKKIQTALPAALAENVAGLGRFCSISHNDWLIAQTGYTGEYGFEVILPADQAANFWDKLLAAGIAPIGLGARDTLRLEAGLNLYGTDMDEAVTPYESGLGWTVAMKDPARDFIGKEALGLQNQNGIPHKMIGLVLKGKGILRSHQIIYSASGDVIGEVTSGTFSPTLECSIGMARISANFDGDCCVEIRKKQIPADIIKYPFVRDGKSTFIQSGEK